MKKILAQAKKLCNSQPVIESLEAFLESYGEVQDPRVIGGEDLVLSFTKDDGHSIEIEFNSRGCTAIYEENDEDEVTSPESMAYRLRPNLRGVKTFELDTLFDSMDVWERQISLGETMFEIIQRNKLWEHAPADTSRLKEIIREWKRIKKGFREA